MPDAATPVRAIPSLWHPLRNPMFRNLLIADLASDIGTFMQSVGAAWLMVSLGAGTATIALTQTASTLPFFLLALPAGVIGDIVDRRKLVLVTETWMVAIAVLLTTFTMAGRMTPSLLLALTFALAAGDAIEAPSWRAILPEVVRHEDLASASALSGLEFNVARAIGPAIAGAIIVSAGVGAAFALNVVSFFGVILVVWRWRRTGRHRTTPPETLSGATVAAIRYVNNSPVLRGVMVRAGVTSFFVSGLLALLPALARNVSGGAAGFGVLLGCFGGGAVLGALVLQPARARWPSETVASAGVVVLGVMIALASVVHGVAALAGLMVVGGAAWIVFISLLNALVQHLAPDWVRARVLALFMLTFQGGLALGSAIWGIAAERAGVSQALLWAGVGTVLSFAARALGRLPESTGDVSPWNHWRMPAIVKDLRLEGDSGPVLVTIEYVIDPAHRRAFLHAVHEYGKVRRRDGASQWGVFRDIERPDVYLETFQVSSWAEHLRQHDRVTRADQELEDRLRRALRSEPAVRHLVYPGPE
jgi:MFS family permease